MKKMFSVLVIMVMAISLGISFLVAQPSDEAVVWVDDDYDPYTPGFGATHFAELSAGVANVASGGTVHVAAGSYHACTVKRSLTILGAGAGDVTISCSKYAFDISNVPFFSISGCTLRGGDKENLFGNFTNPTRVVVKDCVFRDASAPDSGIHLQFINDIETTVEITDCTIHDNTGPGIYVSYTGGASGTVDIKRNDMYGNDGGIELQCKYGAMDSELDITITDNSIYNNEGPGIQFDIDDYCTPTMLVSSNTIEYNDKDGVLFNVYTDTAVYGLGNYVGVPQVEISDNTISFNGGDGFDMNIIEYEYTPNPTPTYSPFPTLSPTITVIPNPTYYPPPTYLSDPSDTSFGDEKDQNGEELMPVFDLAGNTISSNDDNGIRFEEEIRPIYPKTGSEDAVGQSTYLGLMIRKNKVTDNGYSGIQLGGSTTWFLVNNLVAQNMGNGIMLENDEHIVCNNTVAYNGDNGISFMSLMAGDLGTGPDRYVEGYYVNNIVASNGLYGIFIFEERSGTVGDNGSEPAHVQSNDVWGNQEGNYCPVESDLTGTNGNISIDPLFVSQQDLHLSAGSPCIDAGWDLPLIIIDDDLEGTPRPMRQHFDIGCYEFTGTSFTPETFHPLVITQLANANTTWTCIMSNLPDDPELMAEVEPMLEDVQAHMGNATSISNYVQANGELRQALSLMEEIDALCECECIES